MKLDKEVFILIKRNPKIEKKVREELAEKERRKSHPADLLDLSLSSSSHHYHYHCLEDSQGQEQGHSNLSSPSEDEDSSGGTPRKRLRSRRRSVIVKEELIIEEDVPPPPSPIVEEELLDPCLRIEGCNTVPPEVDFLDLDLDIDYVPPQEEEDNIDNDDYSPQEESIDDSSDEEEWKRTTDKNKSRRNLRNRSTLKKVLDGQKSQENESEDEESCEPEKLTLGTGNVVWRCPLCLRQFKRRDHVKPHVLRVHHLKKNFFCPVCDKGFFDKSVLNSHYHSIHYSIEKETEAENKSTGGDVNVSRRYLKNNSAFHKQAEKALEIDDSQKDSQENDNLGNGQAQEKDGSHAEKLVYQDGSITWKCSFCKKYFNHSDNLKRHMDRAHLHKKVGNEEEEIVTVTVRNRENEKIILKKLNANDWKCCAENCGRIIKQLKNARAHARSIHLKETNHICPECGLGFFHNSELRRHQRDKHRRENETSGSVSGYACRNCGKVLSRERYRAIHEATACKIQIGEEDLKKFRIVLTKCEFPFCTRIFADKKQFETHLQTHGEVRGFLCSFCGTAFKTDCERRQHEKMVHQKSDKRFPCEKCSSIYKNKRSLAIHIRSVHEGQKRERQLCDICGARFSFLAKHKRDVHNPNPAHNLTPKRTGKN